MRSTTMPGERRSSPLIVGGGAAIAALLALIIFLGSGSDEPPAVSPPPPPAPPPAAPPPGAVAPPPAAAAVSPQGLRLFGVAGAGAIIGMPDGSQRLVAIGRDVLPGLTLAAVAVDHALLRSSTATYRLGFDGIAAGTAGAAAPAELAPDVAANRAETTRYRLGLAPVRTEGRVTGHVVRPGIPMPALEQAGLRPGDVILRVNGSQLNEEQREELAWTLANSSEVTFEIERDGRRMRLAVGR